MKAIRFSIFLALLAAVSLVPTAGTAPGQASAPFPATIGLPTGFRPEGVAIRGQTFYVDGGWTVQGMVPASNVQKAAKKNK